MSMGIHGQELISESVPVYLRKLDIMDPVSSVALYHFAVLGERIDDLSDLDPEDIPIIDTNGTITKPKTAEQIIKAFAKGAVEEDHVDLIGAQVVLYGSYYDDVFDFVS